MKNKRVLMLLALTTVLSVSMTACNFGGGSDEDSSVVQVTPTPEPTKAAKATPTPAPANAQNTTYTSKNKAVSIKLPDATWANKSDSDDMLSFESPKQGKLLILHGSGEEDMSVAIIPSSQDTASALVKADNLVEGTDFEIQDYKSDQKDGINIYSYTVKYKDTTKSDGYVYAINKYFVNDSEYYSLVASVKKEDALKKVQESVDSFAILGDSTLKSAANGSAAKTAGKGNAAASSDGSASADGNAAASSNGTAADGTAAADGSTSTDGSAASDGTSTDGSSTSDGSSDGTASTDSSSSGAIVNGGFTDEQLGNTDETRTIYRNSDGKPRVIVPDGNGAWMDNEGNRFTFSSQYDCDVYEEDGTSFYWHGEAADVYYMPVQ